MQQQENRQNSSSSSTPQSPQPEMSVSISLESPTKNRPMPNSPSENHSISIDHSATLDLSPTHSTAELPPVAENGRLDWSGRGLSKLPRQQQKCTTQPAMGPAIRVLNISKNSFKSVDLANLALEECTEIVASQNELSQLRQFHPVAHTLLHLNLSDNRINSVGALNSFSHLQTLDLSHNRIEHFPQLDQLAKLESLNLSSNHLKEIPNLFQLKMLAELSLYGNSLRTLDGLNALLPAKSLRVLDLGGNLIEDLTEMANLHEFKALESLTILDNKCTESGRPKFSYRAFIYSCVFGELKILDGNCLSESEIIKGEFLNFEGRASSFRHQANGHAQLCEYLSQECPLVSAETQFANDSRLRKIVEKRREYHRNDSQALKQMQPPAVPLANRNQHGNGQMEGNEKQQQMPAPQEFFPKCNAKMSAPSKMMSSPLLGTGSTTPISTTPKSGAGRRRQLVSRFNTTAQAMMSPLQQQKFGASPVALAIGRRKPGTPISAVVNAKNRQPIFSDKSKIGGNLNQNGPQRSQNQRQEDGANLLISTSTNVSTALSLSSSTTSPSTSSKLSSATVVISKSEEANEPNDVPSGSKPPEQSTTMAPTSFCNSPFIGGNNVSRLPIRMKNAAANGQSPAPMGDFDNASTCALFNATFEDNEAGKKKQNGGFRSVLARKLRRSSAGKNQSNFSSFSTGPDAIRLQQIQKRVDHLAKQNSMFLTVNEGNVATFQELTQKLKKLEAIVEQQAKQMGKMCELVKPTPCKLKYERREGEEADKLMVSWENGIPLLMAQMPVDHYELFLNDQSAGRVKARNKRLLITDINPEEGIKVSIQAVCSHFGEFGQSANGELFVPPFHGASGKQKKAINEDGGDDDEGKENQRDKGGEGRGEVY